MHYWANLQLVHGFRCYNNIDRTRNVSECLYSLYAWFYLLSMAYNFTAYAANILSSAALASKCRRQLLMRYLLFRTCSDRVGFLSGHQVRDFRVRSAHGVNSLNLVSSPSWTPASYIATELYHHIQQHRQTWYELLMPRVGLVTDPTRGTVAEHRSLAANFPVLRSTCS